ncbi:hypothetical protein PHLCEN_2v8536 [Hermanssonia centrifuga]|uniref:RNA polymerase II-associated protein n=1 Tax=Hermanssonia centrifuga TaxID=98765 RepID=A0A2R6NTD3_9APHY|nr:hypothetical protein PHLCEN_2v8536 [Hermanssonia centrifuga]
MRYARPEFLNDIASDTPLPMIVDAECGMPLDLGKWECLWEQNADDSDLNPDINNLPKLDPKDQFLLLDAATSSGIFTPSGHPGSASGTSTPTVMPHVSWLRKTEYISREGVSRSSHAAEPKMHIDEPVDVSHSAQLRDIEASFNATDNFDISTIKHPNKPNVTAVESYEIFPDADVWANAYDLFRFSERPGDRPLDAEDPRLDCAILRPMESDGDHFLAYYLTKEDETAVEFKSDRQALPVNGVSSTETAFQFVRDYEVVKVEQEVPNEFLLVIDDGDEGVKSEVDTKSSERRPKGVYYKNIERKMLLKKKRINSYEPAAQKWHAIKVRHVEMSDEEQQERTEILAEVVDPNYLFAKADADAEGEVEEPERGAEDGLMVDEGGEIIDAVDVFGE